MKSFKRQGDVGIFLNEEMQKGYSFSQGKRVVEEGEGHHHHVLEGEPGVDYQIFENDSNEEMFIKILKEGGVNLNHLTKDGKPGEHGSQHLPEGTHKIEIQKEINPLKGVSFKSLD